MSDYGNATFDELVKERELLLAINPHDFEIYERLRQVNAELVARMLDVVDIARGLSIERDPDRGVYVGMTGDYKDAALLDEALRKLDGA